MDTPQRRIRVGWSRLISTLPKADRLDRISQRWLLPGVLPAAGVILGLLGVIGLRSDLPAITLLCTGLLALCLGAIARAFHQQQRQLGRVRIELSDLVGIDALTGVANRRAFERELERHCKLGADVGLMLIDLDDLQDVNDNLGYAVGNAALRATATRIQACVRTTDIVALINGDEFAVLLPRISDPRVAESIAARIVELIPTPLGREYQSCSVSASVGVVVNGDDPRPEQLLRHANVALATAKKQGKRQYVLYRHDLHVAEVAYEEFEHELHTALKESQLVVQYQPLVDTQSHRLLGVEALVRWRHPERGMVPPLEFIPLAETAGMIGPIGARVLREACKQAQSWRRSSGSRPDFVLSVNVSTQQLFGTELEADVIAALEESGLDPKCLVLEIAEAQMMMNPRAALRQMLALKQLGVRFALDDFGTGHSSLAYLHNFPVDYLKLDKSLTANLTTSPMSRRLLKSVAQLSRTLAIATVAVGVETADQAKVLDTLAIDICQGFFFAKPLDADGVAELLRADKALPVVGIEEITEFAAPPSATPGDTRSRRRLAVATASAGAMTPVQVTGPGDSLRAIRDHALVLLSTELGRRRSELIALEVDDLSLDDKGYRVRVWRSDKDQTGEDVVVTVRRGRPRAACPVVALRRWLRLAEIAEGPVFRTIDRAQKVLPERMSDRSVARVLQLVATPVPASSPPTGLAVRTAQRPRQLNSASA